MPTKDELEQELRDKNEHMQNLEGRLAQLEALQQDLDAQLLERDQTIADFQATIVAQRVELESRPDVTTVEALAAPEPEPEPETIPDPESEPLPLGRKIRQIATGQPYGQGLTLFALDDKGDVWQTIIGREPWTILAGLPGFPS